VDSEWDGWPEDGYGEDTGDTADLSGEEQLGGLGEAGGYAEAGGFGESGESAGFDESGDDHGPAAAGQGYLEDDPMSALSSGGGDGDGGADGPSGGDADSGEPAAEATDQALVDGVDGADPETVVGADPDVNPDADWSPAEFPEQLDLTPPEPVDGYPWSDAAAVAPPGSGGEDLAAQADASPPAQDLLDYAATDGGGDPWAALLGSDDPAASSLGRWWAPG
jgi:hypothetical protein